MTDDFHAWLLHGLSKRWISDVACATHDGTPMTDAEINDPERFEDEGFDDCAYVVRIYEDNIN